MRKRLLITGIVFAALLLALYGVVLGTGGRLMFPTAVALPLAFLPIVSLLVTLRRRAFMSR